MLHTIGLVLIIGSGGGLGLVALYGLADGFMARRSRLPTAVRLNERDLLAVADLTPSATQAPRPKTVKFDGSLADDIFSEIFSLRADIAEMTAELHSLRESLESGARPAAGSRIRTHRAA